MPPSRGAGTTPGNSQQIPLMSFAETQPTQSQAAARFPRPRAPPRSWPSRRCWPPSAAVYESYGFEPLETPAFEYTDALGKFLPDVDRPNEGVFSLKDDDEQWMSLRYDLTAPLARHVAANFQNLPKPFRRYQIGTVWRNEKPGPGRYREFTQFDADTVGSATAVRRCRTVDDAGRYAGGAGAEARRLHRQAQQPQAAGRRAGSRPASRWKTASGAASCCAPSTSWTGWAWTACRRCWARAARMNPAISPRARA